MIVCVTGEMAAGKNAVAKIFEERGWASVDFDALVHQAIENVRDKIVAAFSGEAQKRGVAIVNDDGTINRRAIGSLVFSDKALLAKQEAIVYPETERLAKEFIDSHAGKNIILNATVLYKTRELMEMCQAIVFVTAPLFVRLFRAKKRDGMTLAAILRRFRSQRGLYANYKKTGLPIFKINNASSPAALKTKTLAAMARLGDC